MVAHFRAVHGNRYDYSLVTYTGNANKVIAVCGVHGAFEVAAGHHSNGVGCRKCYFESRKITKTEFAARSRIHFGDRFDYGHFTELPPFGEKVYIRCRLHDVSFLQEARNHMKGHLGCPACKSIKLSGNRDTRSSYTTESELTAQFVTSARAVHGESYDYDKFVYAGSSENGTIICRKHGAFQQTPGNHLRGTQCPQCASEQRRIKTFKHRCKELGIDYWRALKRRAAGLSDEKIFEVGYIRTVRETEPIVVDGVRYPNIQKAARVLNAPASTATITRWIEDGATPEEAFRRVPNPGYRAGIVYVITHVGSGMKYVGITIQTIERRWAYHIEQARAAHIKSEASLHAAIRTFGEDAFAVETIDHGTSKSNLEAKERSWIKRLNSLVPRGFNISTGGTSGGSNSKPVTIDGQRFPSRGSAAEYVSTTRNISLHAAKRRLLKGRIDIRARATPGKSLIKTPAYRAWSQIVHCAVNPRSKSYITGVALIDRWRNFQTFLEDVGQPPKKGLVFARLNKDDGFHPNNCAWFSKSAASKINAAHMKNKGKRFGRGAGGVNSFV